jgi:hypothetical protein
MDYRWSLAKDSMRHGIGWFKRADLLSSLALLTSGATHGSGVEVLEKSPAVGICRNDVRQKPDVGNLLAGSDEPIKEGQCGELKGLNGVARKRATCYSRSALL